VDLWFLRYVSGQSNRQTDRHTDTVQNSTQLNSNYNTDADATPLCPYVNNQTRYTFLTT